MRTIFLSVFFISWSVFCAAQKISPKIYFQQDTMSLAEPVFLSMSVEYPSELTVLFPDSSFNYFPFEFREKVFSPTVSDSLISKDSVVYTLASFEIDQVQTLKLPVFVVRGNDSTVILSNTDSIVFSEMIPEVADSLKAIPDAAYVEVDKQFNYPYFLIGLVVIGIIALIVVIFFGRRIISKYRVYRLKKRHRRFQEAFIGFDHLENKESVQDKLVQWKRHGEFLSRRPYAKLTTTEINRMVGDAELMGNLQKIDRFIYSSKGHDELTMSFNYLKEFADKIFEERVKELEADGKR